MRGLINFDAGELITLNGRDVRFDGLVPPEVPRPDGSYDLQFLDARNRRAIDLSPDEFLAAYEKGSVRYHRTSERIGDEIGDDETPSQAIARRWRMFWTSKYDQEPVPRSTAKLADFIDANRSNQPDPVAPPSPHTLRRWLRDRGEQGARRPRQMGDRRRPKLRRRPFHPFVEAAYEAAAARYWSNYKMTSLDIYEAVHADIVVENTRRLAEGLFQLDIPSRTTLWRWLRQERNYENVSTREGRHVADRQFKAIRNSLAAKRILDVAIIDHKRMDVHVCDSSRRFVIGRPWLAAMIDVKSRMILGYFLSFEDPSVLTAMGCIRAAIKGVPDIRKRYPGVKGDWEAFGVPRTILMDNAWENTGSSAVDACADIGMSIEWAPIRRPEHKGQLERFFSRLDDQLVHKLPGAVIDNPYALAQRRIDPQSDAALTLAQLDELICLYLVDVYSCDLHSGLNDIPLRKWREGAECDGIELAHDLGSVEHALAKMVRNRVLNHEGVKFQGLIYRSQEIDGLLADLLPLQLPKVRPGTAVVKIKYHAEDLSRIFVWNEARNRYVPLPCVNEDYAHGLSERVHAELQQLMRDNVENFKSTDDRCVAKAALQCTILKSYDKMPLRERRRRARMLDHADPLQASPKAVLIDAISNREGGDRPEKAAVRSRRKNSPRAQQPSTEAEVGILFDPFADLDRAAAIAKSLTRLDEK